MTVKELIAALQRCNPDARVLTFDADSECYEPVTGYISGADQADILLQTDSD